MRQGAGTCTLAVLGGFRSLCEALDAQQRRGGHPTRPPQQPGSLSQVLRDPPSGEGGNQVLMAQLLLRCFPEILARPELQGSLCKREWCI